jgi:hypothetical protein
VLKNLQTRCYAPVRLGSQIHWDYKLSAHTRERSEVIHIFSSELEVRPRPEIAA